MSQAGRAAAALALLAAASCPAGQAAQRGDGARQPVRLRLATTTSVDNTGLLAALLPPFEERYGVKVDVLAVGTGQALDIGRRGDADALLAHDPAGEEAFMAAGHGVNRRLLMHNDFVLVGPAADPAGAGGGPSAAAMASVARALTSGRAVFVSRGDDSGTHRKERALWKAAGIRPAGRSYMELGQGQAAILIAASEKAAYALTDRATFLALKGKLDLVIIHEGDPSLVNPYHAMAVNPARHPGVAYMEAMLLIAWLTSPEGQAIIGGFRKEAAPLFHPDAAASP